MSDELVTIKAKFKGYCWKCHYTIWKNERVSLNTRTRRVQHTDCEAKMKDSTPRKINPAWSQIAGRPRKGRVRFITGAQRKNG